MAWDIHSHFEVRDEPGAAWRLVQRAVVDEEGRLDVPCEQQPFGALRSRTASRC